MRSKTPTPEASSCQYAIRRPSGLQRKPFCSESSSSYTQSKVPLMTVSEPSLVSWVTRPSSTDST
jgi:hypothetical protein